MNGMDFWGGGVKKKALGSRAAISTHIHKYTHSLTETKGGHKEKLKLLQIPYNSQTNGARHRCPTPSKPLHRGNKNKLFFQLVFQLINQLEIRPGGRQPFRLATVPCKKNWLNMRPSPSEPSTWWIGSGGERKEVDRGNRDTLIGGGHGWYSVHLSRFSVYMLQMEIQAEENKTKQKKCLSAPDCLYETTHTQSLLL